MEGLPAAALTPDDNDGLTDTLCVPNGCLPNRAMRTVA